MPLRSAGLPISISLRDIRTPADPADKQTTDAKSARPPVEFIAAKGIGTNTLTITDGQAVQGRSPTVSYRVYFVPGAFATPDTIGHATIRTAAKNVASLVAEISAPGKGTKLNLTDSVNFGQAGYYQCVGVNRVGIEAPVEHTVVSP